MTVRPVLEMLDENEVDGSAAQRPDDRDGLCQCLLRHDEAEPGGDLRQETDDGRCALAEGGLVDGEVGHLYYPRGEPVSDGEIILIRLAAVGRCRTQREDLEAGEPGPLISEILT